MKKLINIVLALVVIISAMTSTVFAHSDVGEYDVEAASITGAIRTCPSCGKYSLYTCNGSANHTTQTACTTHENCTITNVWYYTYTTCYNEGCGFTNTVGRHIHSQVHSSTGVSYTICPYL